MRMRMVMLRCGRGVPAPCFVHGAKEVVKVAPMYPVELNQVADATHMIDQQEIR